jgi:predicted outer membrane protein
MRKTSLSIVVLLGLTAAAAAQPSMLTSTDFRQQAMISDSFELESSRLALEKSRNPRIRLFASMMIRDHSMTTAALTGGAVRVGAGPVGTTAAGAGLGLLVGGPVGAAVGAGVGATAATAGAGSPDSSAMPAVTVDQRRAMMLNQLAAAQGRQFDALYASMQVGAHQEVIGLFSAYVQAGRDPGLANFAAQTLPSLQHHYAMASRLR